MAWRSGNKLCEPHGSRCLFPSFPPTYPLFPYLLHSQQRGEQHKGECTPAPTEPGRGASYPPASGRPAAIPDASARLRSRGIAPHYGPGARNASRPHGWVRRCNRLRDPPRLGEVSHRRGRAAETPPPLLTARPPPFACPHLQQPPPPRGLLHRPPPAARGIHGGPGAPGTRQPSLPSLPPSGPAPRGLTALARVTRRAPPPLTRRSSSRASARVPRQAAPASVPAGPEGSGVISRGHTGAASVTALEDDPPCARAPRKEAASPWEVH